MQFLGQWVPNFHPSHSTTSHFQDIAYFRIFPLTHMLKFLSATKFLNLDQLPIKVIACIPYYPRFTGWCFHYDSKIGPDHWEAPWNAVQMGYEQRQHSRSASKRHERLPVTLLLTLLKTSAKQWRSVKKWQETPQQRSRKCIVAASA